MTVFSLMSFHSHLIQDSWHIVVLMSFLFFSLLSLPLHQMKICLQVVHAASDLFWLGRSLTYVVYLVCTHFLLFWGFYL